MMSLYAANNICKGIARYASKGEVRLGGIICNSRNVDNEAYLLRSFAKEINSRLIYFVPRDNVVQHAELNRKTVIEYKNNCAQADEYRSLAKAVAENDMLTVPEPLQADKLEKLLFEYGMAEITGNYRI
jgi:nitrogenase iron protein NifH